MGESFSMSFEVFQVQDQDEAQLSKQVDNSIWLAERVEE